MNPDRTDGVGDATSMEPHRKGDLIEAIVVAELKDRDVPVSIPFGDNERYDLLVEAPSGRFLRIQVKSGRLSNGTIQFDGQSQRTNTTGTFYDTYEDDVDYFVVYCVELESMYLVPEEEVNTSKYLRVEPPRIDHPNINWATDYAFDRRWPPDDDHENEVSDGDLTPPRRGDATEARVIAELLRREIPVSVPPTDNERYDLLAGTPAGEFLRIQVKTGWIDDGALDFRTFSVHTNSQGNVHKPYDGDIDYFLVYVPDIDELYLIGEDEFNTSISPRIDPPDRVLRYTTWAEDYQFDRRWPPGGGPGPSPPRRHVSEKGIRKAVIEKLRRLDATFLRPLQDNDSYDILADLSEGRIITLAVRTAQLQDGRLFFHADEEEPPDAYLLYCRDLDRVYAIANHAFDTSVSLRVDEPKEVRRATRWAEDFELERNWPPRRVFSRKSPIGAVIEALETTGAEVAIPTDRDVPYDLLARPSSGEFLRVAVEPGWVWNGRVRLKPDAKAGIDAFVLHCRDLEASYLVCADGFDASISLRVDPADHDDGTINRAEDYRVSERWTDSG